MAVTKIKPIKSTLSKALDYIQNPEKTDGKMLVSSFGCSVEENELSEQYNSLSLSDEQRKITDQWIESITAKIPPIQQLCPV